jgi:hypothetical protein
MYPRNIPSIAQLHPVLANNPNILNVPVQGVNSVKEAGDPIDHQAVEEAENTLVILKGAKSE